MLTALTVNSAAGKKSDSGHQGLVAGKEVNQEKVGDCTRGLELVTHHEWVSEPYKEKGRCCHTPSFQTPGGGEVNGRKSR
jgi:hypothetical protein